MSEEKESINKLLEALMKTNNEMGEPLEEDVIKQVLFLVISFPLPTDRGEAQSRIYRLLRGAYRGSSQ